AVPHQGLGYTTTPAAKKSSAYIRLQSNDRMPCDRSSRRRAMRPRPPIGGAMADLRLGLNLWSQASDWASFLGAARRADELGYDHIWTWDHVQAIFGDPDQPTWEGSTGVAASPQ